MTTPAQSLYFLSDDGIHTPQSVIPLRYLGPSPETDVILAMLRTAYSTGAYDESKAALERFSNREWVANVREEADKIIDAKALGKLAEDMGIPENDADLEDAAAIAREQDEQHRRTAAATYERLKNKSPIGGHVDETA